jgi:glycosyltransferase involved in cell wall biosynthesis
LGKVWIINHYAGGPCSAAGTRHYDFGIELLKRGLDVTIFSSNFQVTNDEFSLNKKELFRYQEVDGVRFCWIKTPRYKKNNWRRFWNMLCFSWNLLRVGKRLKTKPELIIGSSPHLFAALSAFFLSKFKRSKYFLEIRDLWPQVLIEIGSISPRHPVILVMRLIENFLYKKAEKVIILASGSRDYLLKKGVKQGRIVYIPNGVHLESFVGESSRDILREKYSFDRFTVIYTGAHGPANALENVVKAAEYLKDYEEIEFVLVGSGVSKQALLKEVKNKELNNIRFLDPIPKIEIPSLLKAADVGLINLKNVPSFSFGVSPNKFFDYMASELPIISAVGGEVSRIVVENGIGYAVEPENPKMLAEAVIKLYGLNSEERTQMGKAGRKVIEAHYSRQKLVDVLLNAAELNILKNSKELVSNEKNI